MSPVLVEKIYPVMKHVPVYILYIKIMHPNGIHLPDHPQIYVPSKWNIFMRKYKMSEKTPKSILRKEKFLGKK